MKYGVAGVGYSRGLDANGNVIFRSTSNTDSGFGATSTLEEIRGGFANVLQGQYAHTSSFTVTMKDSQLDFAYLALQVGGNITTGGDVFKEEEIVTTVANQITVTGTPVAYGDYGVVGWYSTGSSDVQTKITFTGKTANVANLPIGTTVCVNYIITSDTARVFEVAAAFIPSVIRLEMTIPLIITSGTTVNSTSSQIGQWEVVVPKFQLNGAIDMATTSAGVAKGDVSGKALVSGALTCSGKPIYAKITENIFNAGVFDNVTSIAAVDVELAVSGTHTLEVYAIKNDGTTFKINNSLLTFTSATPTTATVSVAGLITGVAAGNTEVEVVVTSKTALTASAHVTVTA